MGEFNELIRASAISMIVVILIASLGCLCAIYPRSKPLLGPEARRAVGELILRLVWPCLTIASIGPVLHVDKLLEGAGLIIWAVILVLSAAAITWCFAKMLNLDPVSTAVFALAGTKFCAQRCSKNDMRQYPCVNFEVPVPSHYWVEPAVCSMSFLA